MPISPTNSSPRSVAPRRGSSVPARFVVGRDTRESGPRIETALLRGLGLEGAALVPVGVVPTPAVAFFAQRDDAAAAVISASHNAWTDNGVKLMAAGGKKLPDEVEARDRRRTANRARRARAA